jgi:hypothetical protein
MTEIDLNGKSDHDLLVITVTTLNAMTETLHIYCKEVDSHGLQLAVLQSEHNERKNQADCAKPPGLSKKQSLTIGGIGGLIGAALAAFTVTILEWLSKK